MVVDGHRHRVDAERSIAIGAAPGLCEAGAEALAARPGNIAESLRAEVDKPAGAVPS